LKPTAITQGFIGKQVQKIKQKQIKLQ